MRRVQMNREPQKENDLFFTCSLIEHLARKTNNTKKYIVNKLGEKNIRKIYDLAEVYHSENIEQVSDNFIEAAGIEKGTYDITNCKNRVPSYFELGRIYTRLILNVDSNPENHISTLIDVMTSWIIEKIDNYDSSLYFEPSTYQYECYKEGRIL